MVWNRVKAIPITADYRVRTVEFILLLRMRYNVLLQFLARESLRIHAASRRHLLRSDKRFVVIRQVEAAAIDQQQMLELLVIGS